MLDFLRKQLLFAGHDVFIPKVVLVGCGQLVHRHADLVIVERIEFFEDSDQFVGVSKSPHAEPS